MKYSIKKPITNALKVIFLVSLLPVLSSCIVVDVSEMAKAVGQEAEARNNKYNPIFAGLEISGTIEEIQGKKGNVMRLNIEDMPTVEQALRMGYTNLFSISYDLRLSAYRLYVYQEPPVGAKVGDKVCKESGSYTFNLC